MKMPTKMPPSHDTAGDFAASIQNAVFINWLSTGGDTDTISIIYTYQTPLTPSGGGCPDPILVPTPTYSFRGPKSSGQSRDLPGSFALCYARIVHAEDTALLASNRSADVDRLTAVGSGLRARPVLLTPPSRGRTMR